MGRPEQASKTAMLAYPWRQGRSNPRVLYAQAGAEASKDDPMIGAMDSGPMAAEVVYLHNKALPPFPLDDSYV